MEFRKGWGFTPVEEAFAKAMRRKAEGEDHIYLWNSKMEKKKEKSNKTFRRAPDGGFRLDNLMRVGIHVKGTSLHDGSEVEFKSVYAAAKYLKSIGYKNAGSSNILDALDRPRRSNYGYRWETVK